MTRYRLDCDDDGHWYVVPVAQQDVFTEYAVNPARELPPGVVRLYGGANSVTFVDPQVKE